MNTSTNISWTDATWNPVTGCTKVSPGCLNCYAESMTKRFEKQWGNFSTIRCHPDRLKKISSKKKPLKIFVNSMSDLFHPDIPHAFLQEIFKVMNENKHHTFQVLTKRPMYAQQISSLLKLDWTPNIWMGTSIESNKYLSRIGWLLLIPAKTRFISCEPLLGDLKLKPHIDLIGIDWVIAGGESGKNHRPINPDWIRSIRDACIERKIPFFFKQWGGITPDTNGRLLDGKEWTQFPNQ